MIEKIVPAIGLLISLFVFFEDALYKRIRNEIVYSGLLLVLILTTFVAIYSGQSVIIKVFLLRFIIAGAIGVGLWYIKGWSAGDAKLFWLLSLFFESESSDILVVFNEIFVFLINTFVPVIPVLFISLIVDSFRRSKYRGVHIGDSLKGLLKNIAVAIAMMLISRVIYINFFSHLPQGKYNLISMLIIFFLMSYISRLFTEKRMYLIGGILILINVVMLFSNPYVNHLRQIYSIGGLAVVVVLFRILYESVLKYLDVEIVDADKLRRGDSLSKEFIVQHNLDKGDISERIGDVFVDGLSDEQVSIIKDYLKENKIEFVERLRTFSFSAYIVIGYAFTYFSGFDNIILFIKRFIGA